MSIWRTILIKGTLLMGSLTFLIPILFFFIVDIYNSIFCEFCAALPSYTSIILKNWFKYLPMSLIAGTIAGRIMVYSVKTAERLHSK